MSWLSYATPTIIEQAKVVGLLSAMLWLFQTVLLHSEVHKPDQARHATHTHAHMRAPAALWRAPGYCECAQRPRHSLRPPLTAAFN